MAKVDPFHSIKPSARPVYHNNTECTEGNNIEKENLRKGTDNRPLCDHCSRLS